MKLSALFLFLMTGFLFSSFSQAHVCTLGKVDSFKVHKYRSYDEYDPTNYYGYSVKINNNWYKLRTNIRSNLYNKEVQENLETIRMAYFFGGNIELENNGSENGCLENNELLFTDVKVLR
ncbi:hypothetical protein [Arsenophonus nasoniae]|uniref:Uncharacterized protein n=1 Tax=Arsenophonus nasoniae TaxID=638 RepID=A0AA95GGP7_9GAMM|nr:hypothetical protein [Arsenophonus nasoniae]WGL93780.1 hypothetical protein QE207_00525 [Arsenophonus nasoniae]WGL96008.1 hypothetical protein QE207_05320 [Arsenophonus nasoniae]